MAYFMAKHSIIKKFTKRIIYYLLAIAPSINEIMVMKFCLPASSERFHVEWNKIAINTSLRLIQYNPRQDHAERVDGTVRAAYCEPSAPKRLHGKGTSK